MKKKKLFNAFKDLELIYIIMVPKYKERGDKLIQQLKDLKLYKKTRIYYSNPFPECLTAEAKNLMYTSWYERYNNDKVYLKVLSVAMAHYNVVKIAYDLGYNNVLILEDDTEFNLDNKERLIKSLKSLPNDFNVLKLCFDGEYYYRDNNKISNAGGYILSRQGMEEFIKLYNEKMHIADLIFKETKVDFLDNPEEIFKLNFKNNSIIENNDRF